jgi:hypothetical protein
MLLAAVALRQVRPPALSQPDTLRSLSQYRRLSSVRASASSQAVSYKARSIASELRQLLHDWSFNGDSPSRHRHGLTL